ncbi:MAG TPA: hypothetical protein VGA56_04450, partial [Opitutaceae bacterium]
LRLVVPLMGFRVAIVLELVAECFLSGVVIIRSLDHLVESVVGLRCVESVRVNGRALDVVNFPVFEMWAGDFPLFACTVRSDDKRALAGAH